MTRTTAEHRAGAVALVRNAATVRLYAYGYGFFGESCDDCKLCDSRLEAWTMALKESNKRNAGKVFELERKYNADDK